MYETSVALEVCRMTEERLDPEGPAVRVGKVVAGHPGLVVLWTAIGGARIGDQLSGDQRPRICSLGEDDRHISE